MKWLKEDEIVKYNNNIFGNIIIVIYTQKAELNVVIKYLEKVK